MPLNHWNGDGFVVPLYYIITYILKSYSYAVCQAKNVSK